MPKLDQDSFLKAMRSVWEFLKTMGIRGRPARSPFPKPLSLQEPEGPEIPPAAKHDGEPGSCGAAGEPEPEPGFQPPASSLEYAARYPGRIRATVEEKFKEMLIKLPEGRTFEDFLQEVISRFVEGSKQGDDLAKMYDTVWPPKPGECKSAHFHRFVELIVEGIAITRYPPPLPDPGSGWEKKG